MYTLKNELISVEINDRGGLSSIALMDGPKIAMRSDELRIETDYGMLCTGSAVPADVRAEDGTVSLSFETDAYRLTVKYDVPEGRMYCRRYLSVENRQPLSLYRITSRQEMAVQPKEVIDYNTFWNCPTVGFIRFEKCGLYTGFENPYFSVVGDLDRIETSFEPALILKQGENYLSEANFFGIYQLSGRILEQCTPATSMRYNDTYHTRYRNPCGQISLDWAEIEGFQAYARDYLELRVDEFKLIFYQFFLPIKMLPTTDEEEQRYYHYIDNFVRMGGDMVTITPVMRNAIPDTTENGYWRLLPEGSRAERIVNYVKSKGMDVGYYMGSAAGNAAYCASAMTPFALDDKNEWKKRDRNGHCSSENCMASDAFARWFYKVQHNTIQRYGITLWDWDHGPGNGFFCYGADHGHIPGKGAYKGFRNAMNIVKRLKEDFPKLYIHGFHGTKEYGLWGFRGFDQHECYWEQEPYNMSCVYPDVSEDRLTAGGMRFQSIWNQLFRFLPPEINHALASRMTQNCLYPQDISYLNDQLGWKYAFFSSLAVGASMTVTMMPYDLDAVSHGEYVEYFRKWIPWAKKNFEYTHYNKPFGSQVTCGMMDGYARIKGDHGFLFLFNPGPVPTMAKFEMNDEIGLRTKGKYRFKWLYPMEQVYLYDAETGRDCFDFDSQVHMRLEPFSCTLLEMEKCEQENHYPCWRNLPGDLDISGSVARIDHCVGREGTCGEGWLLNAQDVEKVCVNGTDMPFVRKDGAIMVPIDFGRRIPSLLDEWEENGSAFAPLAHSEGRHEVKTSFFLPQTLRDRLESYVPEDVERQTSIIRALKAELKRDNFAWAQAHRLHLTLPFAELNHVEGLKARLNDQELALELVDGWHDDVQTKILCFADITDNVKWEAENTLVVYADWMPENSFMGARLEYPEGNLTSEVCPDAQGPEALVSYGPIGIPRQLRAPAKIGKRPVVEAAWIVDGIIHENRPYTLCASVNLPEAEIEGVYASAQISIDPYSRGSLRADQRLIFDPVTGLWKRDLLPGSRRLLIIDGKDIHVWAVSKDGTVSVPFRVSVDWHLQAY